MRSFVYIFFHNIIYKFCPPASGCTRNSNEKAHRYGCRGRVRFSSFPLKSNSNIGRRQIHGRDCICAFLAPYLLSQTQEKAARSRRNGTLKPPFHICDNILQHHVGKQSERSSSETSIEGGRFSRAIVTTHYQPSSPHFSILPPSLCLRLTYCCSAV